MTDPFTRVLRAIAAACVLCCGVAHVEWAAAQSQSTGGQPLLMASASENDGAAVTPARADDSLYIALGAQTGITKIVDGMIDRVLADPITNVYFENASIHRIKEKIVEQFCVLSGGPCTYTGRPMKRAHAGEKITAAAFDAVADHLKQSMDANGIPAHTQNALLALLAPMSRDIVEQP